jgi:HAMP domain-containing protein
VADSGTQRAPPAPASSSPPTKTAGRLPRLPLPAKLFLSYMLVLAVAAVPSFIYVRAQLEKDLAEQAAAQLLESARRTAAALAPLDDAHRVERAREFARMIADRVSLIAPTGEVLFDSETKDPSLASNHRDRPEVKDALAGKDAIAARRSATTGHEMLYVAVRVEGRGAETVAVVRLARRADQIASATAGLQAFARNVQAAAISVAIGLSLLAAIQFVRPLQRVTASARALAAGDLSARSGIASNDEVGDAGAAIDTIAAELRRRLAFAGSGDAVIAQLVDALPIPCIVFEVTGEVLALNGAARTAYRVEGPHASRRLRELTATPGFERALDAAEGDGEPAPITVDVAAGIQIASRVHVLKRPGMAPFYLLLGVEAPAEVATTLPPLEGVTPRPFTDVLAAARRHVNGAFVKNGIELELQDPPAVLVVDVGDRLPRALAAVLEGCAQSIAGRSQTLSISVKVDDTRVKLKVEADCGQLALDRARPLLEPLGGAARIESGEAALWLPRA